jgi:hypothetical protein
MTLNLNYNLLVFLESFTFNVEHSQYIACKNVILNEVKINIALACCKSNNSQIFMIKGFMEMYPLKKRVMVERESG